jgi:hypothetical protein
MNIYILGKDHFGWSLDQDYKHICSFISKNSLNIKIVNNILSANYIYCVSYNILLIKKYFILFSFLKIFKNIKIIAVITNDITIYHNNISKLFKFVDAWVAPNRKIYSFIKKVKLNVFLIPFYVDKQIFKKTNFDKKQLCEILNINIDKIKNRYLIGSFQRDSLGTNINEPKWQKNPDLLISILRLLPKSKFILILAGPLRHYIVRKCKEYSIPFLFIGNETYIEKGIHDLKLNTLNLNKISLLYNLIDLYIVTSQSETGPKAILEAPLTKTLIISTNVGLASDILAPEMVFSKDPKRISEYVNNLINCNISTNELLHYNYKSVNLKLNENNILKEYNNLFKSISYEV